MASPQSNSFSQVAPQDMRDALALFATGVTVVTTCTESGPVGITVNSFSAVSLDPPLVLWSLNKSSNRTKAFEKAKYFAVHVLSNEQKDVCFSFTKNGNSFDPVKSYVNDQGVPVLEGCISRFECRADAVHDGGDHLIFVARVEAVSLNKGDPLIYYDRSFGVFSENDIRA